MTSAPFTFADNVASRLKLEASCHSYYTDFHDIYEDIKTVARLGGRWRDELNSGMFYRRLYYYPDALHANVASRLMDKKKLYSHIVKCTLHHLRETYNRPFSVIKKAFLTL